MVLADSLTATGWVFLGIAIAGAIMTVHYAMTRSIQKTGESDANAEETNRSAAMAAKRVTNLEVRLHDFSREVEARLETRASQLDSLVAQADREIVRLGDLLKAAPVDRGAGKRDAPGSSPHVPRSANTTTGLSSAQEQMALHLHGAGFSVAEIAHIVGGSPESVRIVLKAA